MYAIIETGGKQYRVEPGAKLQVEKLEAGDDKRIVFDKVLACGSDAGTKLGTPYLSGAQVVAECIENGRGDKIIVATYKRRKKYRLTQGHRQSYTEILIKEITL